MSVHLPRGKSSNSLKDEPKKKALKKFTAGKVSRNSSYGAHLNKLTRIKSNDSGGSSSNEPERPNFQRSKSSADMLKTLSYNKLSNLITANERTKSMTNLKMLNTKPSKYKLTLDAKADDSVSSEDEEEVDTFDDNGRDAVSPPPKHPQDKSYVLSQPSGREKPMYDAPLQASESSRPSSSEPSQSYNEPSVPETPPSSTPTKTSVQTRTQQKLWLQRENLHSLADMADSNNVFASNVTRLAFEQLSREFLSIRRYSNPTIKSLARLNTSSLKVKKTRDPEQPDKFAGRLADFGDVVDRMWKKNCTDFEQQHKLHYDAPERKKPVQPQPQPVRQYGHPPPTTRAQQQAKRSSLNVVNLQN
ncbi:hypothetical protein KL918_003160 [Ogataea parapolymorpha]|uniref:Uncharacterized protein n=1 Tax=Ogataea parapolymorpha (strain ATCC 26012 / BCRC 20466 / JCM 22074 / NRRL Y-7560 / DL-1) TaxID=871575 RepID=W1QAD8_OGAPD|nr:hypothetical protein HPODL_01864 [Ogataea parapolymorpha DL-1]ESW97781.1 hypothetical protein HPODL_01864 [Ogataea parapolymorpha DL-1]KAG7866965.1 hypothetical protein KL918_003160 [Ogataea parapolymorpha]KAG7872329.1 hypothetical protein KL916_003064 [Ogataea parapolymorpha]